MTPDVVEENGFEGGVLSSGGLSCNTSPFFSSVQRAAETEGDRDQVSHWGPRRNHAHSVFSLPCGRVGHHFHLFSNCFSPSSAAEALVPSTPPALVVRNAKQERFG